MNLTPKSVRQELGLSKTECGRLFLNSRKPYRAWQRIEASGSHVRSLDHFFAIMLLLNKAKKDKQRGASKALDLVKKEIESITNA